jgi:hypothetical protein
MKSSGMKVLVFENDTEEKGSRSDLKDSFYAYSKTTLCTGTLGLHTCKVQTTANTK